MAGGAGRTTRIAADVPIVSAMREASVHLGWRLKSQLMTLVNGGKQ